MHRSKRYSRKAVTPSTSSLKLSRVRLLLRKGVSNTRTVPEIQGTTQEIARYKARAAASQINGPCITEVRRVLSLRYDVVEENVQDTALCFSALGGLPGPYIRTFLDTLGHDGASRSCLKLACSDAVQV